MMMNLTRCRLIHPRISHWRTVTSLASYNKGDGISGVPPRVKSWINGQFHDASSANETIPVPNPNTGDILTEIEVAACEGQRRWAAMSGAERGRIMHRAANILTERNDALSELEAIDTGRPISETPYVDVISARDCIEYMGGLCSNFATLGTHVPIGGGQPGGSFAYTRREPLGVTAGIGAWNYPIQGMSWKVAPALACGNSIVFKPSELTPLTALALAEVFTEAGLYNIFHNICQHLSQHPNIAKVSFTGSRETGSIICKNAAPTLKY
eukprot:GSMAST32.ASY1.ANO1.2255.1 assembled CDS